jgi:hypothetical protein
MGDALKQRLLLHLMFWEMYAEDAFNRQLDLDAIKLLGTEKFLKLGILPINAL